MADVMEQLAEAAKALKEAAALSLEMSKGPAGADVPLQWAQGKSQGARFGSIDSQFHYERLGQPGPNVAARKAFLEQQDRAGERANARGEMLNSAGDYAAGGTSRAAAAINAFDRAARNPVRTLDELAKAGGRLGKAAELAAAGLRVAGAHGAAFGRLKGAMEVANPNAAGQLRGSVNLLIANIAGQLTPLANNIGSAIQQGADSWAAKGAGKLAHGLGWLWYKAGEAGLNVGRFVGNNTGGWGNAAFGDPNYRGRPSMEGLPQPKVFGSFSDWYDQAAVRNLAMGSNTVESDLFAQQVRSMEAILGELRAINRNTADSVPGFR
jgi:hypothetical protein